METDAVARFEARDEPPRQPFDKLRMTAWDGAADLVAELFGRYHTAVFAYIYRLVNDREWAHD